MRTFRESHSIFRQSLPSLPITQARTASPAAFALSLAISSTIRFLVRMVMGHILHDWNLETKHMFIAKVWDAPPEGGRPGGLRLPH
jgi:hypothetical protein